MNKKVIILAGPTASGKTASAIRLALRYNTEIISADSRQCFKEMNIGVAKPSAEQLATLRHHFINSHSIHEHVSAALFEQYALDVANRIFESNDTVVMAGGTGLYIKAFCEGLDEIPTAPEFIRKEVEAEYADGGLQKLQAIIKDIDPLFSEKGEIKNPRRLMRAIEIKRFTGQSILNFHKGADSQRPFDIVKYGISISKEQLHVNINSRVEQMISDGLVEEVHSLMPYRHLNALQTVGYSEIFEYLDGNISLAEAVEKIKVNTRQYAKRQMTWFRKDTAINWLEDSLKI